MEVVGFTPGYSTADQSLDIIAEDFGKLFLDQIQLALKYKKGVMKDNSIWSHLEYEVGLAVTNMKTNELETQVVRLP